MGSTVQSGFEAYARLAPQILAHVMTIAGKHTRTPDDVTAALWEGWAIDAGTVWFAAFPSEDEGDGGPIDCRDPCHN